MKIVSRLFLVLSLLFVMSMPAYAGWKSIVEKNRVKADAYITQLQDGANPDRLERPTLRRGSKGQSKRAYREMQNSMTEAEALARAGKHGQIKIPVYSFDKTPE